MVLTEHEEFWDWVINQLMMQGLGPAGGWFGFKRPDVTHACPSPQIGLGFQQVLAAGVKEDFWLKHQMILPAPFLIKADAGGGLIRLGNACNEIAGSVLGP